MALIKADRVKETSTSTGTGTFTLAGAAVGFRAFSSVCSVGDTFFYVIDSDSGSEWETGLGTYSATNTLTRTTVYASSNSGSIVTFSAGTKNVYLSLTGRQIDTVSASPPASTGAPPLLESLAGAAHTALTASTEYSDIYWNLARTVQFSTGAITTQRSVRIAAPTYSFVAASTITTAATVQIDGAPVAGTNATITNRTALRVLAGSTTAKGIVVQGASGQTANIFEVQNSSGTVLASISSTGSFGTMTAGAITASKLNANGTSSTVECITATSFSLATSQPFVIQSWRDSGSTICAQITNQGCFGIIGRPKGGATKSDIYFNVTAPADSFSLMGGEPDYVFNSSATETVTGTQIWSLPTTMLIKCRRYASGTASTISDAYGVYIENSPVAGTNVTITRSNALFVNSNQSYSIGLTIATIAANAAKGIQIIKSGTSTGTSFEVVNGIGGSTLMSINANGSITPATLADSAAANNTIYYSSTAGKLVYKDSAGTVNNLY